MNEPSNQVLAERIAAVNTNLSALTSLTQQIHANLQQVPVMARDIRHISEVQEAHAQEMAVLDRRMNDVEVEMPGLKELRRWVIGGILAALAMMGGAIFKLAISDQSVMIKSLVAEIRATAATQAKEAK